MLTFFRSHWLPITASFAFVLVTLGAAFYYVHSSGEANRMAIAKIGVELKAVREEAEKSKLELQQAKLDVGKEQALGAKLKTSAAASQTQIAELQASLAKANDALAKASKVHPVAVPAKAVPCRPVKCKESAPGASAEQLRTLRAEIDQRDAELRERQKQLDEAQAALAAERRKCAVDSEYRWPHNGTKGK